MIKYDKTIFYAITGAHISTSKLEDRLYFHCEIKKTFPPFKAPLKNQNDGHAVYAGLICGQHLKKILACIYHTMLIWISTHTQTLVTPTNLHLATTTPTPYCRNLQILAIRRGSVLSCVELANLNISTVLNMVISQNLTFKLRLKQVTLDLVTRETWEEFSQKWTGRA